MNKEIDYLKEHLYEIYQYKKSMKDLTYDMDIEHLLRTCKALDYSQKEIERLNNIIEIKNKRIQQLMNRTRSARIDKAIEIYENRNSIKYKKKRFMEDKSTSDLMYEALKGSDKE